MVQCQCLTPKSQDLRWLVSRLVKYFLSTLSRFLETAKGKFVFAENIVEKEMEMITNVSEYEVIAKEKLPKMVYDYYASGAEDQWTLKENRNAFSRILFRPRILIDVSKINMMTTILGFRILMPIMVAPTAMQKMAHPEGECATARAASDAGTIMTLSSYANSSVEEVASTRSGIRFFQLYLVRRAERAGFKAIALTADTPRLGRREADIKNR
ncbi:hypothetical protein J1N35_018330 [Gossypium stocksii]|uniref:FMN hydroxy acid dehydrogenase domain-containing protein n=1 Tax=Gossypium stocksii TaxID=47602 RepID=A0A9D4A6K3_9ROSI|nr:hypothetical protein J1N35_018330 [Gossypium stocksii]